MAWLAKASFSLSLPSDRTSSSRSAMYLASGAFLLIWRVVGASVTAVLQNSDYLAGR